MHFDPKGQRSNIKVIKVTDIAWRPPIFTIQTPFRVACSFTNEAYSLLLGTVTYIDLYQMSFDPEGRRSNIKIIKVTDITCASIIFTPGALVE